MKSGVMPSCDAFKHALALVAEVCLVDLALACLTSRVTVGS